MSDLRRALNSLSRPPETVAPRPAPRPTAPTPWAIGALALLAGLALAFGLTVARPRTITVDPVTGGPPATPTAPPRRSATGLSATGYLVPDRQATVGTAVGGRLEAVLVRAGDRVTRGQVVARLESADADAELARSLADRAFAEADLAESERRLELSRRLAAEGVLPRDALAAADSAVALARASLGRAQAQVALAAARLDQTLIRAPFAGVILERLAEAGEVVAGGSQPGSRSGILVLADPDTLEVESDVAETQLPRLWPGQAVEVTVAGRPGERFRGTIRRILPVADRSRATVRVRVRLDATDPALRPEMSARLLFAAEADEADLTHPAEGAEPTQPTRRPS